MGIGRTTAALAQVRDVVDSQGMSIETLCVLLQLDTSDILEAFEDRVLQYADQFGVNMDVIADLAEDPVTDEEFTQQEIDAIEESFQLYDEELDE